MKQTFLILCVWWVLWEGFAVGARWGAVGFFDRKEGCERAATRRARSDLLSRSDLLCAPLGLDPDRVK